MEKMVAVDENQKMILNIFSKSHEGIDTPKFQKIVYLMVKGFNIPIDFHFNGRFRGPYSPRLDEEVEALKNLGLLKKVERNRIQISSSGSNVIKKSKIRKGDQDIINKWVKEFEKLNETQLAVYSRILEHTCKELKPTLNESLQTPTTLG